jgi:hypothetical protein
MAIVRLNFRVITVVGPEMLRAVKLLPGLPPHSPLATPFPAAWGRRGGEGTVVEFQTETETWVANFAAGIGGMELAAFHPNRRDAVVIAAGELWVVNPIQRSAERLLGAIEAAFEVEDPNGWEQWHPFRVDLRTGRSTGGTYFVDDASDWQRLADGTEQM